MHMIFLENDYIKASFAIKGAELQSLTGKKNNISYLWDGNSEYWAKFSPVLFPIVGGLKNDSYYLNGTSYPLSRHGFARDMDFEVNQISATAVMFTLRHTDETLNVFPFQFTLQLLYQLKDSTISCTYHVVNPADTPMFFSIGGHPAFATPVNNDIQYGNYYLKFNKDTELSFHKIDRNLVDNQTVTLPLTEGKLHLEHELFYQDALVFKSLKSDCISLRNDKTAHGIHFKFNHFPFFGIWAAKDANFVCLEPWCGIADGVDHQQDLTKKEGIVQLGAKQNWQRTWEVTCF